jgi:hypothetical protein
MPALPTTFSARSTALPAVPGGGAGGFHPRGEEGSVQHG